MWRYIKPALATVFGAAAFATAGAAQSMPSAVSYDPSRLTLYSTKELIDLLSQPSLDLNIPKAPPTGEKNGGLYSLLPLDSQTGPRLQPSGTPDRPLNMRLDSSNPDFAISIESELVRRGPIDEMAKTYASTDDRIQQAWMADALGKTGDPRADAGLRPFVNTTLNSRSYFSVLYFSRKCDPAALKILNENYAKYQISSVERASSAKIFGDCRYIPASDNLVESVNAMILNLGEAAHRSLSQLYPDAHIPATDAMQTQAAWEKYLRGGPPK